MTLFCVGYQNEFSKVKMDSLHLQHAKNGLDPFLNWIKKTKEGFTFCTL